MPSELDPGAVKVVNSALQKLKELHVNDFCPRCSAFDWGVEPIAIQVIPLRGPGLPSSYYPAHISLLQITCNRCGYTLFHNLKKLGL